MLNGGGISGRVEEANNYLCAIALNLNCVVFSVDYRLGPEVKCPTGMHDFIDGLEDVVNKADQFSIDSSRICIAGDSGGGWIVAGAANILASEGRSHLVKAMFIYSGMLSDETSKLEDSQMSNPFEVWMAPYLTSIYKLHAKDFQKQQSDPFLYPGRVNDVILEKLPMTAVWTSEFDFYRRDNETYAKRLQSVARLIDISVMPGMSHGY